jgi:GTP-binding protein
LLIKSVEFAGAVAAPDGPKPASLPEIAFSGKSNVGKSSLINRLLGRTRTPVARVSGTPGKTQEINFYRVRAAAESGADASFFLVDLPGYGFARVPLAVREKWKPLMESYLGGSQELRGVIQLVDARHGPTPDDRRMVRYLANLAVPTLFVLTKVDKLHKRDRTTQIEKVTTDLGVDPDQVLPFSARTGEGREELMDSVEALLTTETQ